jgi:DNA polymerase-3 subunit chi
MTEIGFYHLTRSTLEQALPRLLGRVLAIPARALVLCPNEERLRALDDALWLSPDPDWLPHGVHEAAHPAPHAAHQPILLSRDDAPPPNGARHLFLTEGARSAHLALFERGFDLFDGNDEAAVADARDRWRILKAEGHALAYWQQGAGGWERKA